MSSSNLMMPLMDTSGLDGSEELAEPNLVVIIWTPCSWGLDATSILLGWCLGSVDEYTKTHLGMTHSPWCHQDNTDFSQHWLVDEMISQKRHP